MSKFTSPTNTIPPSSLLVSSDHFLDLLAPVRIPADDACTYDFPAIFCLSMLLVIRDISTDSNFLLDALNPIGILKAFLSSVSSKAWISLIGYPLSLASLIRTSWILLKSSNMYSPFTSLAPIDLRSFSLPFLNSSFRISSLRALSSGIPSIAKIPSNNNLFIWDTVSILTLSSLYGTSCWIRKPDLSRVTALPSKVKVSTIASPSQISTALVEPSFAAVT